MRILVLYRHFWPDSPPYASMLRSIGRTLVEEGHQVAVWAEEPCYKPSDRRLNVPRREILDGVAVERFARLPDCFAPTLMQMIDKLLFVPRLLLKAIVRRTRGASYDLVWTATIPPVVQGWAGRTIARLFGAKFLYHCQDLYPELAAHMGFCPQGSLLYHIMMRVERRTRESADLLVTLSDDMAETIRALGKPRKLAIINNFPLEDFSAAGHELTVPVVPLPRGEGKIQLIFAGNLGIFQGLETVVEAMRLIETDCPLELILMGEGKALADLKRRAAGLSNVRFEPHRPYEEARALIAAADIGLISLEPEIYRCAFPSKTLTYLELGVPLLAILEPESKLAQMIEENRLGWVAPVRNPAAIGNSIRRAAADLSQRPSNVLRVSQWFKMHFDRQLILDRWSQSL